MTLAGRTLTGPSEKRARQGLSRTFQHPQLALELSAVENIVPALYGRRMRTPLYSLWWALKGARSRTGTPPRNGRAPSRTSTRSTTPPAPAAN